MRESLSEREVELLLCFADYDMRVTPTAKALRCHPKTVSRTLKKIFRETGYDPAQFWDLYEIMKKIEEGSNKEYAGRTT